MYTPLAGDSSWEIVALFYNVKGPLATILSSNNDISNIFKTLWRIKHMDFLLSKRIWISQIANAKVSFLFCLRELAGSIFGKHIF